MSKEDKEKPKEKDETQVHVLHVGDLAKDNFKVSEQITLRELWDQSYAELDVDRDDRDGFQAVEGEGPNKQATDLVPHLGLTLAQAIAQGLTKTRRFEITVGTGGA